VLYTITVHKNCRDLIIKLSNKINLLRHYLAYRVKTDFLMQVVCYTFIKI